MNLKRKITKQLLVLSVCTAAVAREYHVSPSGNDSNVGTASAMLRTISAAAQKAQPGDTVMVHAGTYRERIDPPRGGTSDRKRIVYRAAEGETVTIKGSERVTGWKKVQGDTWEIALSNKRFGSFNPFADEIHGDWFQSKGRKHHTGAVYLNGHWLTEAATREKVLQPAGKNPLWFAKVDPTNTVVLAQFPGVDPNREQTEVNARRAVFYPSKPGINFITLHGFILEQAATPWAPPTAEQVGLVGTHWSKGWIIENNVVRYSTCCGITLGKYGDQWDNTSQNSARGYVKTIDRALENGWSKENIGHHIVRNNKIYYCEQGGVVGSLGAIFSTISNNEIHDIHVRHLFSGAEMAGIKIHAAIDTTISGNHIYRTVRGIWLDWMNQGSRVTRNLLHDNGPRSDLFIEVNHGPYLVDHNFFLSKHALRNWSEGGAYAHNVFVGKLIIAPVLSRATPFHPAHSTQLAGISKIEVGDDRFYNNIFIGQADMTPYDTAAHPVWMKGNVFLNGAKPSKYESDALVLPELNPTFKVVQKKEGFYLKIDLDPTALKTVPREIVTSKMLGTARTPKLPFRQPDGSLYKLDHDFLNAKHPAGNVFPGPIEITKKEKGSILIGNPF